MKTVKVRIAVVINDNGSWNACGYHKWNDKYAAGITRAADHPGEG